MPGQRHPGLDKSKLGDPVQRFYMMGLAESTHKLYACGVRRFMGICATAGRAPVPANEDTLCHFAASLAVDGLRHRTIKSYMAGVRHLHISEGYGDPFSAGLHRLHYVLRGVKRAEGMAGVSKRERMPITPDLLRKIKGVWNPRAHEADVVMLWAACCLAFFGFMRIGELTVPSDDGYDASGHLSWGDVLVDDPAHPSRIEVRIKASKTDPFRQGISIFIGRVASDLCPVAAMLAYLVVRGKSAGPLFRFIDGKPLTRQRLVTAVKVALEEAGVEPGQYSGHSFRIGAATTAAARGLEDSTVRTLGRWKSLAYLEYIKIPRAQLASYTARIC